MSGEGEELDIDGKPFFTRQFKNEIHSHGYRSEEFVERAAELGVTAEQFMSILNAASLYRQREVETPAREVGRVFQIGEVVVVLSLGDDKAIATRGDATVNHNGAFLEGHDRQVKWPSD